MATLEVCLSPELINLHPTEGKTVVVVDILRATSCMVTALGEGIESITPVATVEECLALKNRGYLTAGERNGVKVEEFHLGNSPLSYLEKAHQGKKLAMTTTNGTRAISLSQGGKEILVGAFLNLSSVITKLIKELNDTLIFCAGWKGKVSYEDSLFAGALVDQLASRYEVTCDAALMCRSFFQQQDDLLSAIQHSSHYQRLKNLKISRDFEFCVTKDKYQIVPTLIGHELRV